MCLALPGLIGQIVERERANAEVQTCRRMSHHPFHRHGHPPLGWSVCGDHASNATGNAVANDALDVAEEGRAELDLDADERLVDDGHGSWIPKDWRTTRTSPIHTPAAPATTMIATLAFMQSPVPVRRAQPPPQR